MKLFGRKTEAEKQLDDAKADLIAAKSRLAAIDAREAEALKNSQTFATWSGERQAAATEVDRIERLAANIVTDDQAQQQREASEAVRKRIEAAKKKNAAVADRLIADGPKLFAQVKALARDIAASQVETDAINRALPTGISALRDANSLARGRAAIPRENVAEKEIELWVRATDGGLIGDQDAVQQTDATVGHLFVNSGRVDCIRRKFRSVQYHPEVWSVIPEAFHTTLRLPNIDTEGVDFDGSRMIEQAVAELDVDLPKAEKKTRRPVQTELIPVEAWTPPVVRPVGAIDE